MWNQLACSGRNSRGSVDFMIYICSVIELTSRGFFPDGVRKGAFHPAPLVKIVMSFRIQEVDATHCLLTTETRVYAAGTHVLRGFVTYWRMIYPGSALIRRMWLRAIKLRAEAPADAAPA